MISKSYQRNRSGNRDSCSHFLVIYEIKSKFLVAFVKLILGKVGVDGFTGPQQEEDITYDFSIKVIL